MALLMGQATPPKEPITANSESQNVPSGRWRTLRRAATDNDTELTDQQKAQIARLNAIGYLSGSTDAPGQTGVVVHDTTRAHAGLNFYTSGHASEAILMSMDGRELHRWRYDFRSAFPDYPPNSRKPDMDFWRRAHLFQNGDILAIHEGLGILKLDRHSKLIWARPLSAHHDLEVMPDGDIYVLTREAHIVPWFSEQTPVLEDFISILDSEGKERERISVLKCFEDSTVQPTWRKAWKSFWEKERTRKLADNQADLFHTNSIEVLDGRLSARIPEFKKGHLLLSMCHLDTIAVVDPVQRRVVWSMTGASTLQHDPTITPDANLMLFDNAWEPGRSSITVFDLVTRATVWHYRGSEARPFHSRTCGTARRLANGNTLVTESDNGRAFELSPDKEIVWEFFNPHRAGNDGQYIATLFDLVRIQQTDSIRIDVDGNVVFRHTADPKPGRKESNRLRP